MSTLYDSASLVMIPSGVKEDKLYSIKPTDGSGDFTFSRGSDIQATRVNSSGLIEKAKVNLFEQSNSFDTSPWSIAGATLTGGQTGYDGSSDAWLYTISVGTGNVRQTITNTGVNTYSVYAKAGSWDWIRLSNNISLAYFDLSTGSIGTTSGSGLIDTKIESVGNGWYRCSLTFNGDGAISRIYAAVADNDLTSTGGTIYIQDAQLNHGLIAQDYVETTTTAVVEGLTADLPRLDYSGGASCPSLLLEPSRTNIAESSEQFNNTAHWVNSEGTTIIANDATSPEGVQNAFKLVPQATDNFHRIIEGGSLTNGNPYTFSIFAKKGEYRYLLIRNNGIGSVGQANLGVDLEDGTITYADSDYDSYDIEDYGNGWYRIWASADAAQATYNIGIRFQNYEQVNSSISTFTGDGTSGGYVYGWQIEAGYLTSYIPTYGTAANRGQDEATKTGVSSLLNDSEGTLFLETKSLVNGVDAKRFSITNGTSENRVMLEIDDIASRFRAFVSSAGVTQTPLNHNGTDHTQNNKVALVYTPTSFKMFINGVLEDSVSINASPIGLDTINFGNSSGADDDTLKGYTKQVLLFKTALTDAECIALTTI